MRIREYRVDSEFADTFLRTSTRDGARGLMLAVLENAIEYFQAYAFAKDKKGTELFNEAEQWILEESGDGFFSFENICDVLGLNARHIRLGLLHWKETKPKARPKTKGDSLAAKKKSRKSVLSRARTHFLATG